MLQELIRLIPSRPPQWEQTAMLLAVLAILVGLFLWTLGTRVSRSLVTLVLVALGTYLGLFMPRTFGWGINGWGPAIGGAIVLGVAGYIFQRFWIGVGLGLVAATWAALIVWAVWGSGKAWTWPAGSFSGQAVWHSLPAAVAHALPLACGLALVGAAAAGIAWPKFGRLLFYSAAGVTLAMAGILSAVRWGRPDWLAGLSSSSVVQAGSILVLIGIGMLLQWSLMPKAAPAGGKPAEGKKDDGKPDAKAGKKDADKSKTKDKPKG